MTNWRDELEQRATRGMPRGADAIFDAASMVEYAPDAIDRTRRRSLTLVAAGAVTVAAIGGGAVIAAQGDEGASRGVPPGRCSVFLDPGTTEGRIEEVRRLVESETGLSEIEVLTQQDAHAEFRRLFAHKPDLVESVTPEVLPPSVRFLLADPTAEGIAALEHRFDALPDVRDAFCSAIADGLRVDEDADCWITTEADAPESTHAAVRALLEGDVRATGYTYRDLSHSPLPIYEVRLADPSDVGRDALLGRVGDVPAISGADCPRS